MDWKAPATSATLALLLAGCAAGIIEEKMQPMIGQPASHVFEKLGIPDAEDVVAGRRFYVWETEDSGSILLPQQNTGSVYTAHGTSTYTYMTYVPMVYSHTCRFRVFVDANDLITTYDFDGNEGGCSTFATRLSR